MEPPAPTIDTADDDGDAPTGPGDDSDAPTGPGDAPAEAPRPVGPVGRVATALCIAALALFGLAVVLFGVPVEVPEVQDCGAPIGYLLEGRVDVIPNAEDQILGPDGEAVTLDPEVADSAREEPCRERVAARAVPAAVAVAVGFVLGMVAFALELFVVRPRRRALILAEPATPPPDDPARSSADPG